MGWSKHFWGESKRPNKRDQVKSWGEVAEGIGWTAVNEGPALLVAAIVSQIETLNEEAKNQHELAGSKAFGVGLGSTVSGGLAGGVTWLLQRTVMSAGKALNRMGNASHLQTFSLKFWGHKPETSDIEAVTQHEDLAKSWGEALQDAAKGLGWKTMPALTAMTLAQLTMIAEIVSQQHDASAAAVLGFSLLATATGVTGASVMDAAERAAVATWQSMPSCRPGYSTL